MNCRKGNTAILFFSRTARKEAFSKPICRSLERRLRYALYQKMVQHSLSVADESAMTFFIFDETCQSGSTFGERLANAFSALFAKGYDAVISIGNDCPELSCGDLLAAREYLKEGKNVLGPDLKGGTYLIGILAGSFHHEAFANLDWNTERLYHQLSCHLQYVMALPPKADMNTKQDLQAFVKQDQHYLAVWLKELLFGRLVYETSRGFTVDIKTVFSNKPRRAPPIWNSF